MGKSSGSKRRRRNQPSPCDIEAINVLDAHFEGKSDEVILRELHTMLGDDHKHSIEDSDGRVKDMRHLGGAEQCETTKAAIARHYALLRTSMAADCTVDRQESAEAQVAALLKGKTPEQQLAILHARVDHAHVRGDIPARWGITMTVRDVETENSKGRLPALDRLIADDIPQESTSAAIERHRSGLTTQLLHSTKPKAELPSR